MGMTFAEADVFNDGGTVDPVMASQLTFAVSQLSGGALGEAGKQAWEAFLGIVRRIGPREPGTAQLLDAQSADDLTRVDVDALVRALVRHAEADPEFAASLREWWAATDQLVRDRDQGNVNIISGTVHGPSVQARDITGSINFGTPSRE
jgi:hypothetical protein